MLEGRTHGSNSMLKRRSVLRVVLILALLLVGFLISVYSHATRPPGPSAAPANASQALAAPVPLCTLTTHPDFKARALIVPIVFNHQTLWFSLDTGCGTVVFDKEYENQLGKPLPYARSATYPGHGNETHVFQAYHAPAASVGTLDLSVCSFVDCDDLSWISNATGVKISGILGMSFLKHYVVQLDCDAGKIEFFDAHAQPRADWGWAAPYLIEDEKPLLVTRLGGDVTSLMYLDTGDIGASDAHCPVPGLDAQPAIGFLLDGPVRAQRMFIEGHAFDDVLLSQSFGNRGLLGFQFLRRFVVTLDAAHNTLYFQAHTPMSTPREFRPAMNFTIDADGFLVAEVWPGGPAEKVDIRPGDRVLAINNQPVLGKPIWEFVAMCRAKTPKTVVLTIQRPQRHAKGRPFDVECELVPCFELTPTLATPWARPSLSVTWPGPTLPTSSSPASPPASPAPAPLKPSRASKTTRTSR